MINHIDLSSVLRGAVCELYSNLVTRPTGAAVRSVIEERLADMATAYLANASRLQQQVDLSEQLSRALTSRVVVEQAKGVLAEAAGVSVDDAFQRIRVWARNHNTPLHTVAARVVEDGLRP